MNRGWLKHGNPGGDLTQAARCGAKTRRGVPCQCPAMSNGRCQLHDGKSTGPKTAEGIERSGTALGDCLRALLSSTVCISGRSAMPGR